MSIRQATPPNLLSQPDVRLFRKDDFSAVIFQKGYDIILEQAIECPCRGTTGAPDPTCNNCLGTGYVFINPLKTKALITSINKQTKYQQWSPELTGTINVTVRDEERLSYMDKITFDTRHGVLSEVRPLKDNGGQKFIFTSYRVEEILNVFIFDSTTTKLTKIDPSLYSISSNNKLVVNFNGSITYPVNYNGVVSIEYKHKISYNIIDLPHDFRSTFLINDKGQNIEYNMPIQGVARRSHLELGQPSNYGGANLINNDTL